MSRPALTPARPARRGRGARRSLPAAAAPARELERSTERRAAAPASTAAPRRHGGREQPTSPATSRSPASGPATSRRTSRPCSTGSTKQYPNVTVKYNAGRRPAADRARDGGRRRQAAGHRVGRAARPDEATSRPRARSSRSTTPRTRRRRELRPELDQSSAPIDGKLYGLVFKAANKSTVWYNVPAFTDAGVQPPKTLGRADHRRRHAAGLRHPGVLDRRRRRLDAHRPVREHLPAPGGPGQVRPAVHARDPVDRPVGQGRADDDGEGRGRHRRTSPAARPARSQTDFPTSVTQVFSDPPKAAMVFEGDFVGRRHHRRRRRRSRRPASTSSRSRRINNSPASRGRRRRHGDHVQGHARRRRRSSSIWRRRRRPRSGPRRAASRRPNKKRRPERLPGRRSRARPRRRWRTRRRSASTCPTCSRPRSAARSGRASGRPARTS